MTQEEIVAKEAADLAKANEMIKKAAKEEAEVVMKVQKEASDLQLKEVKDELEAVKKSTSGFVSTEAIDKLSAEIKKMGQTSRSDEQGGDIETVMKSAFVEQGEKVKGYRGGNESLSLKAVTDASFAAGVLGRQTTDVRRNLYMSPYSPLYLRNIFPNVSTDGGAIVIPQIQSITGAAAVWARSGDTEKPEVTPTYKDVTVTPVWIAGVTTVNRELLLNVSYLRESIVNTLLYSRAGLFAAENKMITDYLAANAVAYSGDKTIGVEIILDAAFNQLLGNYMAPTHILMNQADYLTFIKFNKATGSGEYDLPNNELRLVNSNGLEINLQIVPVPSIAAGTAYVVAANEFEFINRLNPEIKMSEDHGNNFTLNKVTFRAEEMAAFIAKDLNAAVKITLPVAGE